MRTVPRAASLLLSVTLATVGCSASTTGHAGSASSSGSPSGSPSALTVRTVALHDRQIVRFSLTGQPDWLGSDDRYLYVKEDSGEVAAIDPRTNRVAWRVQAATELCQGLGVGFGSLWTCAPNGTNDTDDLVRIDPRSHRVVATWQVGKSSRQGNLVAGFGRVWVINSSAAGSSLIAVDPATGKSDPPVPLGMLAVELAIDDRAIWAVGSITGQVVAVDGRSRTVVHRVEGLGRLGGPSQIMTGGGVVWVSGEKATAGIDGRSGKVVVDVAAAATGSGGFVATKTDLWIHSGDPFLLRVDPTTGQPIERIIAPDLPSAGDVMFAFGSLWASANNQSTLVRVRV